MSSTTAAVFRADIVLELETMCVSPLDPATFDKYPTLDGAFIPVRCTERACTTVTTNSLPFKLRLSFVEYVKRACPRTLCLKFFRKNLLVLPDGDFDTGSQSSNLALLANVAISNLALVIHNATGLV